MEALSQSYDEYLKQEENLSGVLNTKTLNLKNIELRDKIKYWRDSKDFRDHAEDKVNEKQKQVFEVILKYQEELSLDKELVENCKNDYIEMIESRHNYVKDEHILNDFLVTLDDTKILEIRDLKKGLDNYRTNFFRDHAMLNAFVDKVCRECVLNQHFFSFFDVADLLVKMIPSKADYPKIITMLNESKKDYLKEKTEIMERLEKDKKIKSEVKITDEDLVPLELLRNTLSNTKYRFNESCEFIKNFIDKCQAEVTHKIRQLQVENNKIKKIIENNVFIARLNKTMEDTRIESFSISYKIRILHLVLTKALFKTAKDVSRRYFDVIQLSMNNNIEFKERLMKEMSRFNNKESSFDTGDTISDIDDEKLMKVFQRLGAFREGLKSAKKNRDMQEDMDNTIMKEGEHDDSKDSLFDDTLGRGFDEGPDLEFEDKDPKHVKFDIKPFSKDDLKNIEPPKFSSDLDEEDEEEREIIEERMRKEAEEREWMAQYKDTETGEPFNPIKRFGRIDPDYLVYDNATSSYPLNLPADYYQRYIKSTIPSKKDGKWFIRPHHIEKLTTHVKSIKDDVLNTNYYSHYHDETKNKVKNDDVTSAIQGLEAKINELRDHIKMTRMANGTWDPDEEELLETDPEINREARNRFEALMNEGKSGKKNRHMLEAFEALLYEQRRIEKEMLNLERDREYEKNRPPQDGWYKLKTTEFSKELYRNRMALKPNNQNRVYLDNLKDPYLY